MEFKKGDKVNFKRAGLQSDNTIILAVVDLSTSGMNKQELDKIGPIYVIEHESGWIPNEMRQEQYGLDAEKRYLFVKERELTKK